MLLDPYVVDHVLKFSSNVGQFAEHSCEYIWVEDVIRRREFLQKSQKFCLDSGNDSVGFHSGVALGMARRMMARCVPEMLF